MQREKGKKYLAIQPKLCSLVLSPAEEGQGGHAQHELLGMRDSHDTELKWGISGACLCDRTCRSLKRDHIRDESTVTWDQKKVRGHFFFLIFSSLLSPFMHEAAFMLFQEITACTGLQWQGCSAALQAAQCCSPTIPDPVLVPHRLVWEGETNTNMIRINSFYPLLVFSFSFYLHFLCLFSLQVYVRTFAETANSHASYRLRTCRNYSMHKE